MTVAEELVPVEVRRLQVKLRLAAHGAAETTSKCCPALVHSGHRELVDYLAAAPADVGQAGMETAHVGPES